MVKPSDCFKEVKPVPQPEAKYPTIRAPDETESEDPEELHNELLCKEQVGEPPVEEEPAANE